MLQIKEIISKSILTPSKLPDCDYVVNPYTGCAFGCTYCYASFMGRYVGLDVNDWGNYVFVKKNAVELLRHDLKAIKNKGKDKTIFFSSVTDPYQGVEAKYKLTRSCLEVLVENEFAGEVSILTKSALVTRDTDVLKKLKNVEVGFTITSTNDGVSRYFEKFAPNVTDRLKAMKEINEAGILTYAFIGPLLPHFSTDPKSLESIFEQIYATGTKELYIEHINLKKYILDRLLLEMPDLDPKIKAILLDSKNKEYRNKLNVMLEDLVKKYGFKLRLGSAIYHQDS